MILPFDSVVHNLRAQLIDGIVVDRGEWQGKQDDRPMSRVREIHNVHFTVRVDQYRADWGNATQANLPWAEDHFQERIFGEPFNPGVAYKNWPWYKQGVEEHKETGQFSHTYMERFWPKLANLGYDEVPHDGIRFWYGDLNDLIELLKSRPFTRQAYLPIWFPEDLTAVHFGERVPCTLGYHFQAVPDNISDGPPLLNITYNMRSCDFFRYLNDDVYMAGRLLHHVADATKMRSKHLTVNIANLHIFADETNRLEEEHQAEQRRRLAGAF